MLLSIRAWSCKKRRLLIYLRISVLKRRRSCPTYSSYSIYGLDVKVTGLAWSAWCLQRLGYPDRGPGAVERGAASEELGHRVSQAFALCASYNLFRDRRDHNAALAQAEMLVELSADQDFPFWLALGNIDASYTEGKFKQDGNGIQRMRDYLDEFQATGARIG